MREDDAGDRVIVLCTGRAILSCASEGGRVMNLKIAMPGDVLGLSAVISGSRLEISAEAMEATVAKIIPKDEFVKFLNRNSEASMHAVKMLAAEYTSAFHKARRLALSGSVTARLAALLLDWGTAASCGKVEMRFMLGMSHDEIARFTGTSRETITRTLTQFKRDKIIAIHGAVVHLLLPKELEMLAA